MLHVLLTVWLAHGAAATAPPSQEALQAAWVERFTRFVTWPNGALGPEGSSFVLCHRGTDAMEKPLRAIGRKRKIAGRPLVVRHLSRDASCEGCHALWISVSERDDLPRILDQIGTRPVLTLSAGPGLAWRGVHLNLVRSGSRLGFEANLERARDSGLKVSSKLLRHARAVRAP